MKKKAGDSAHAIAERELRRLTGDANESFKVIDDIVKRFGSSRALPLRTLVAEALFRKAGWFDFMYQYEEEVAVCDEIVARFKSATEAPLREWVVQALARKARAVGNLRGRRAEEVAAYQEIITLYKTASEKDVRLRGNVAAAALAKGSTLELLNRRKDAISAYKEAIQLAERPFLLSNISSTAKRLIKDKGQAPSFAELIHSKPVKRPKAKILSLEKKRKEISKHSESSERKKNRNLAMNYDFASLLGAPGSPGRSKQNNTGEQTAGNLQDPVSPDEILNLYFDARKVPEDVRPILAAEIARVVARALPRPSWLGRQERGGKLATLTAPLFLKQVYADEIGPDGKVHKDVIRDLDPGLMDAVETYISQRARRKRDLGDAAGLAFVTSRPATNSRPKIRSRAPTPK